MPTLNNCPRFTTLLSTALLCTAIASAADWNQYRGPQGTGKSSESIDAQTVKGNGMRVVWRGKTELGFSSFAVTNNFAYTLVGRDTHETLVAFDASSGKEVWTAKLSSSAYEHGGGNAGAADNRGGDGPRSTPTTDGTKVYVYDGSLVLSAFEAKSGKLLWRHDIVKDYAGRNIKWSNATSPVMDGDLLFVGGGGDGQSLLAFNKNSGELVWKSGNEVITHATPTIDTIDGVRQVIFFVQSGLVSVNAQTGKEIWRTKFPFSVSTAASPVVESNMVYCSAGYGVGAGLFEVKGSEEPREVWFKPNELMNHWSTPIVRDGYLYGIYEFKKYGRAPLQCVDLKTGEIKWSQRGFGPGNCILVGDKLIVLSDAGVVAIVEASPEGYNEIAKKQVLEGKCWSTPAFSDGKIYVRSTKEAACLAISN